MKLVFDVETNGFLEKLNVIHSLVLHDVVSGKSWSATDQIGYVSPNGYPVIGVLEGLAMLEAADLLIGHNIIKFDLPAIQKVYPWFTWDIEKVLDTLVMSRLIWPDIYDTDTSLIRRHKTKLTPKLAGRHSLESWGVRLGFWKGDYSEVRTEEFKLLRQCQGLPKPTAEEIGDYVWSTWVPEMQSYCEQDVVVNTHFYHKILTRPIDQRAVDLEHMIADIMAQVETNGYHFNVEEAEKLYVELAGKREDMTADLVAIFPPWYKPKSGPVTPKRSNSRYGYWGSKDKDGKFTGFPYTPIKEMVFNPGSRDHIADRLMTVRGWKPTKFSPKGGVTVDDEVLSELSYPEAAPLAELQMLSKIIGMLAEGKQAWLKQVKPDGRMHGSINTNAAVTGRATHSNPNVGQVPSVKKPYGKECRALFGKPYQLGCDVSGLELRMLGHFMAKYDDGAYAREVIEGDVHTVNMEAAGLPDRDVAKTFIYAFLYGAGNLKIGSIVGKGARYGDLLKKRFFKKVPALKKLVSGVVDVAKRKGKLNGLDGRKLHIRSSHAALNTLLQSAGALVCKQWIVEFVKLLKEAGYYQTKVRIVAWVHDEIQMELDPSLVTEDEAGKLQSEIGDMCVEAIRRAGDYYNIRVPLTGEYKIGNNWKDCH